MLNLRVRRCVYRVCERFIKIIKFNLFKNVLIKMNNFNFKKMIFNTSNYRTYFLFKIIQIKHKLLDFVQLNLIIFIIL